MPPGAWTSGVHVVGAKWRREVPPSRRLTAREQSLPWAILSFPAHCRRVNQPALAVGTLAAAGACSKIVNAGSCPLGPKLVIAARLVKKPREHWRSWHASQLYRATIQGKERRREQARRYREPCRQRSALAEPAPPTPPIEPASPVIEAQTTPDSIPISPHRDPAAARASAQPKFSEKSCGLPCTGQAATSCSCPRRRSPDQQFCSGSCRQALRRVRQREARLRRRRQRGSPASTAVPSRTAPSHARSCRHVLRMPSSEE